MRKKKIVIPATIDHISIVRNFVEFTGIRNKYSTRVINATKLAVEEAVTNIIRHGYVNYSYGEITVEILSHASNMTVILIDQGKMFDPLTIEQPDLARYVEKGKIGGLGIMMIRKLMDELYYTVTERGNELRLIKYRDHIPRSMIKNFWFSVQSVLKKHSFLPRSS
jgi:serine/threonine-protein kinase RsbW